MEVFVKDNGELQKAELEERKLDSAYKISVKYKNDLIFAEAADWFAAMQDIRKQLEDKNIQLLCNGSRKEIYPSGMSRSMGGGRKAYICNMGNPAVEHIDIFESLPDIPYCRVAEQEKYHQNWISSLKASL